MTDDDKRCIRCRIGKMWTVDGKELCMGCSIVIRQTRILELEREAIMGLGEIDSLRARLAETVEKAKVEVGGFQKVTREAESQRDILVVEPRMRMLMRDAPPGAERDSLRTQLMAAKQALRYIADMGGVCKNPDDTDPEHCPVCYASHALLTSEVVT